MPPPSFAAAPSRQSNKINITHKNAAKFATPAQHVHQQQPLLPHAKAENVSSTGTTAATPTRRVSVLHSVPCIAEGLQITLSRGEGLEHGLGGRTTTTDDDAEFEVKETYRSWLVLVLSALTQGVTFGIGYSSGIFSTHFVHDFDGATAAQASLTFALVNGMANLIGPVANASANILGHRETFCIGAMLAVIGFVGTFFSKTLLHVYISYGIFVGMAFGIMRVTSIGAIGLYFNQHRNLAASLAFGGASAGCVAMPMLITWHNQLASARNGNNDTDNGGWRSTMLMFSGIFILFTLGSMCISSRAEFQRRRHTEEKKSKKNYYTDFQTKNLDEQKNPLQNIGKKSKTTDSRHWIHTVLDADLLCSQTFLVILLFNFFSSGFLIYHMVTMDYAQHSGLDAATQAPLLISLVGVGDVLGKIVMIITFLVIKNPGGSANSSVPQNNKNNSANLWARLMAIFALLTAAMLCATIYAVPQSFHAAAAVALAFGCVFGLMWCCYPSLIMEAFGSERLTACQGYANFVCGVAQVVFLYATARVVDVYDESYEIAYWFGGACLLVSAIVLILFSIM